MPDNIEELIKKVYKIWKSGCSQVGLIHPDEEKIVCFLERTLPPEEEEEIKIHLINCEKCAELFAIQAKLSLSAIESVPVELLKKIKNLAIQANNFLVLEIILQVKDNFLKLLNTNGDNIIDEGLMPGVLLRSPGEEKNIKGGVTVLKKFGSLNLQIKIKNKTGKTFDLSVFFKKNTFQKKIQKGRVTLLKDGVELESYFTNSGNVIFEDIFIGRYTLEIFVPKNKIVRVILDIQD